MPVIFSPFPQNIDIDGEDLRFQIITGPGKKDHIQWRVRCRVSQPEIGIIGIGECTFPFHKAAMYHNADRRMGINRLAQTVHSRFRHTALFSGTIDIKLTAGTTAFAFLNTTPAADNPVIDLSDAGGAVRGRNTRT